MLYVYSWPENKIKCNVTNVSTTLTAKLRFRLMWKIIGCNAGILQLAVTESNINFSMWGGN